MPGKTVRVGADSNTRGTSTLGITDDKEDVEEEEEEEVEDEEEEETLFFQVFRSKCL